VVASQSNIVGRQNEIEAPENALDSAKHGNGRTIGLFGEPGIGKSSLVSESTESATTNGFDVLKGYCREHGGAPAYWPWIELIRGMLSGKTDQESKQILGENVGWLAEISPDAARIMPADTADRPTASPEEFRFQLFDSLSRTLKRAAEDSPLLLILEDIHWADESSLYLLELLAASIGDSSIAIVFTSRDYDMADNPQALTKMIGELNRWEVFSRIDLTRLSLEATTEQLALLGGDSSNIALRDAIFASSEGNPFFTAEVVRLLAQEGKLSSTDASDLEIGIPTAVSEVINRRISRLNEQELDLLQTCSVVGQQIEIGLLADISGLSPQQLLQDLDRPITYQILQLDGSNLRFSHALIAEAIADGLSVTNLVSRNATIAESLLEFADDDLRPYVGRLATHYIASQAITGIDRAVEFSLLAGEEALRFTDFESSRRHFNTVLELKKYSETDEVTAQAMGGLWKIVSRTAHESEIASFVTLLTGSFNYFIGNGDTARAIDLAAWATTPYSSPRGIDDVIARALEIVDPESIEAGKLHARKCVTAYMERQALEECRRSFDQAVQIARKFNDTDLELQATAAMLSTYAHSKTGIPDAVLVERGTELANDSSDLFLKSTILFRTIAWYASIGDQQSAHRFADSAREIDDLIKSPNRKSSDLVLESSLFSNEGNWSQARKLYQECLLIDPTDERPLTVAMRVEYETGNFATADKFLDQVTSRALTGPGSHSYTAVWQALNLAYSFEINGNESFLERAKTISESVMQAGPPTGSAERSHRVVLLAYAVHTQDVSLAQEHFKHLENMAYLGDVGIGYDRTLAMGAALIGEHDKAEAIYNERLLMRRNAGHFPELAWTCFDYSTFLLNRNANGDSEQANKLVAEALEITNRLGMPPLQAKLEELTATASNITGNGDQGTPAGLSQREVEVLQLVATGMTNGRIADELFISTNTVIRHVSNIMSKTETASRTEAGLFAERNGLLGS
jgi:DNA-binding CsgD family transcriptional regulator/tetratricopeptide (TPR) repeat protein